MENAVARPSRLIWLRIVAGLLIAARSVRLVHVVVDRQQMLADNPGLSPRLLGALLALSFIGVVALAFLAFARQRWALWIVVSSAAVELALEVWAGFSPVSLIRIPVTTALVFLTARMAWRELR
jgi:hypothetical protein